MHISKQGKCLGRRSQDSAIAPTFPVCRQKRPPKPNGMLLPMTKAASLTQAGEIKGIQLIDRICRHNQAASQDPHESIDQLPQVEAALHDKDTQLSDMLPLQHVIVTAELHSAYRTFKLTKPTPACVCMEQKPDVPIAAHLNWGATISASKLFRLQQTALNDYGMLR